MATIDKHPPGSFNWLELATTDQNAAKQFYGSLLGWKANDFPMGPDGVYTMFQIDGRDAAACYTMMAEQRAQGVPPNWGLYVAVESADDASARAVVLGGKILRPAIDVYTFGRMATIQDPTGAFFSVWQPNSHIGIGIAGVNGSLCWADLNTPDPQRAKAFYEQLFKWQIAPGKDKPADSYLHIKNGEKHIGGIHQGTPPHWLIYFQVADCDASTEKAKALGGSVHVPPMTIENSLRFSIVADPQGAVFALFTSVH